MSPAELYARRNAVDPVNPSNGLRRSEALAIARRKVNSFACQIDDLKRASELVAATDRPAYGELIKVACQALESAGYIIDHAGYEIEREVAK